MTTRMRFHIADNCAPVLAGCALASAWGHYVVSTIVLVLLAAFCSAIVSVIADEATVAIRSSGPSGEKGKD